LLPNLLLAQVIAEEGAHKAAAAAGEKFNAGEMIIQHVSNTSYEHPLIQLPRILGIDFSVTKHVFVLWFVAAVFFIIVTWIVRRYLKQERMIPSGLMNGLELIVEWVRDSIVLPNVGSKWVITWTPLVLTFFLYILCANLMGLIPLFDILALLNKFILHSGHQSFLAEVVHGGPTATGNFNVTAGLATVTFFAIIVAGSKAHGFITHWKNMVPPGTNPFLYIILVPIEILGMFVKPFALTMRLAANMTGGHIAILAILSFVFLFTEISKQALVGIGVGVASVVLAVGISALEIIVVLVQAYVFTLLTAVFIGMAIHVHH
jgi:F-type H+-transporting ATPase subunit a